jgi:hypothetical protein
MVRRRGRFTLGGQKEGSLLDSQDDAFRLASVPVIKGGRFLSVGLLFMIAGQKEGSFI